MAILTIKDWANHGNKMVKSDGVSYRQYWTSSKSSLSQIDSANNAVRIPFIGITEI